METKWCYKCDEDKVLREFHGPKEHKNALCIKCFDGATNTHFENLGFSDVGEQ